MSEFIKLDINLDRCLGIEKCGECIQICPVNIFTPNAGYPKAVEANEDECTLCKLCLQGCEKDAITIHKLYEEGGSSATKAQRHKQLKIDNWD